MKKSNLLVLSMGMVMGMTATALWAADSTAGNVVDDSIVTAKVKTALIENPATKARQINVETKHGVVQLNGFVESAAEKQAAETAAKQVNGVMQVSNNLQLRSGERTAGAAIDDTTITAKVKAALVGDSRTKAHQVEVKTYNGVVSLGGFVSSEAERQAAAQVAQNVAGVVKVENGVMVKN